MQLQSFTVFVGK